MKTYWGVEVQLHAYFDLGTRWRWLVSFIPRQLYPRERAPGTHWIGSWVGPRAVLDAVVKRKIPSPHRELNRRTPIVQPVVQRFTDWAIVALDLHWLLLYVYHFSTSFLVFGLRVQCLGAGIAQWYSSGVQAGWSGVRIQTGSGAHQCLFPWG
jgi:hypothetical protein